MRLWKCQARYSARTIVAWSVCAFVAAGLAAAQAPQDEAPADREARLRRAAAASPDDAAALRTYAQFLDQHRSPEARAAYGRLAALLERTQAPAAERVAVQQRLAELGLIAGERDAASQHLSAFAAAGGTGLAIASATPQRLEADFIEIPGPIRSFSRMAALAPDLKPEDVLPALARNVVTSGYRAYSANDALEQTEFLSLVMRYLTQARELERIAGPERMIRVPECESSQTAAVLRVIGYRMRGGCGAEVVLETVNASRAFLTTDSGFPLAEFELALRTNEPFELDYTPSRIPLLFTRDYWQPAKEQESQPFIDYFLSDPSLARLYVGLSKIDSETARELQRTVPAPRLKLFAHVLDFYGSMFVVRNGRAVVPGAPATEKVWSDLNGVNVDKGVAFFERMLIQDDGWLASYYDAVARMTGPVQQYLLEPARLERFYEAIRGRVTTPGPARPVFRSNTDMLLLTARLRLSAGGQPYLPGGIEVWKQLFAKPPKGAKYDDRIKKAAPNWKEADDVLEALFALSRKLAENEPLKIYMAISDLDRRRATPLSQEVVQRLIDSYATMRAQFALLGESPDLRGETVLQFLDTAESVSRIRNQTRRGDTAGTLQGLLGLWQIFVRQGTIAPEKADGAMSAILAAFAKIDNDRDIFDAGRNGVQALMAATSSPAEATLHERMLDLLAGTASPAGSDAYQQLVQDLIRVFEAQRLVRLDDLFQLAGQLEAPSKGGTMDAAAAARAAGRISEIQLPQANLTSAERGASAFGYWTEEHVDSQRKLNLRRDIDRAKDNPEDLAQLRGKLTPYLRDTLVGLNYMHYTPPGAQVLLTNSLFVRSHDFVGHSGGDHSWDETVLYGAGWPRNAGGRLVGSLASLPYALAQAEQNFLVPEIEQALIWGDLVPQMMVTAVVPRWWNVSATQLHWVGLHTAYAESLLAQAALSEERRTAVFNALSTLLSPYRMQNLKDLILAGDVPAAIANVLPSEMYRLARALAPADTSSALAGEIRGMGQASPGQLSETAISRAFGTPKPMLANSYQPELLGLRTFPTLMGYSSRILAESWESNLLYFAALADQIHAEPRDMNVLVPEWTQRTVESIFATHLEDWPALLRSLRRVGAEVLDEQRVQAQAGFITGGQGQ